ncbi:DUF3987 domain-containing protein [Prosthecobacter sp.]|jgi:hypothetical protein|uniref:DUF3987 domain-containing protein n=1 Tax=Prosthecobacter sp. TaxID=1965333 RepID=UPI0037C7387B
MNTASTNQNNIADFAGFGIETEEDKPFPVQCLPQVLQTYLREICRIDGVCEALPGACMLGTLSMALGSGAEIDIGEYRVRGNLFILGSARSGTGKSVVFKRVVQAFLDYEKAYVTNWREKTLPGVKAEIRMLKQRQETLDKQAAKLPQTSGTDLQEATQIERRLGELDRCIQEPCMTFSESTREKIADLVSRSPTETLASVSAEARGCIGTLMGRYNSKTDEDMFVALWSGDYCKISRIHRPDTVLQRPCLSLLWLVQPDLLDRLLSSDDMLESGFLARTLFFEASPPSYVIATKAPGIVATQNAWQALVWHIAFTFYHQSHPVIFPCQQGVMDLMTRFRLCLMQRTQFEGDLADVYSFAARWVEQTWRIMLVLHVTKLPDSALYPVSMETANEAIQLMDWFATQQLLLLTAKRERKTDERFEALLQVLSYKPGQCCSLRDLSRRHGFQETEVRTIVLNHQCALVIRELKAQGPGRPSPGVAIAQV